jgi:protein gp37
MTREEWDQVLATEPATPNQVGSIVSECERLGLGDRDERLAACAEGYRKGMMTTEKPRESVCAAILDAVVLDAGEDGRASREKLEQTAVRSEAFANVAWHRWLTDHPDVPDVSHLKPGEQSNAIDEGLRLLAAEAVSWLVANGHLAESDGHVHLGSRQFGSYVPGTNREADLFYSMRRVTPARMELIRESMRELGDLRAYFPVLVDAQGDVVDGRHRRAIDPDWPAARMQVPRESRLAVATAANRSSAWTRRDWQQLVQHRQHTSSRHDAVRAVVRLALREDHERSNRKIAELIGAHHETVAVVRKDLETTGEIRQWSAPRSRGGGGGSQPRQQHDELDAEVLRRVRADQHLAQVRTNHGEMSAPAESDDSSPRVKGTDGHSYPASRSASPPPASSPQSKPEPVMLTLRTHTGEEVSYPKPKAKAKFNETPGEGISWAAWSWNPLTGCLHNCEYCYAREIASHSRKFYPAGPDGFTPLFHEERLGAPANTTVPAAHEGDPRYRRVFVCSMADLYGQWVSDEWISRVHEAMLASPQWEYILLTKFPSRYLRVTLPPGAWVGTSVDEQKRVRIAEDAFRRLEIPRERKWLSLEPLREPLEFTDLSMFGGVVIGAQTETRQPAGTVPALAPDYYWVHRLVTQALEAGCKIHLKPNLVNGRPGMTLPDETFFSQ